jgi:hypothetical protein
MKMVKFLFTAIICSAGFSTHAFAQWTSGGGSDIYNTAGGNVIVGGTSTRFSYFGSNRGLEVQSSGGSTTLAMYSAMSGTNFNTIQLFSSYGTSGTCGITANANGNTQFPFVIATSGIERFRISAAGKIGIGTTAPVNIFDVAAGTVIGASYAGTNTAPTNGLLVQGNVGIGTTAPANKLDVAAGTVIGASYAGTNTAPTNGLLVQGNVGIGITAPANLLDVAGGSAIGSGYAGTTSPTNGLIVKGNTGIGTKTPVNKLDVAGGLAIGSSYAGTNTVPTNGLLVQGKTGIGTSTIPTGGPGGGYKLAVSGNMNIDSSLVIGTTSSFTYSTPFPAPYKLYVAGGILTEKLKVSPKTTSDWSDFVFDKNYKLRSLSEVETYINENKHLPGVASAEEVIANGIDVAKMDAKLLEKIEELTLYMIEIKKENEEMKKEIKEMKTQMSK